MLELIYGRASSGKTHYCLNAIKKELLEYPLGPEIILLLPEHMTYKVERELASMMAEQGSGFVRCHVWGFRRFAYQVLADVGGGLESGLTELGRQLLLKKILGRRKDELQVFSRAARQRGFAKSLGKIIDEMKSYGISAKNLSAAAEHVDDKRLHDKLMDLSLLTEDFSQQISGRYQDKGDTLNRLIEKLPLSKMVQGADIWLDGFLFFNPQEQLILKQLFKLAANVHITLTLEPNNLHSNYENTKTVGTFYRSYKTMQSVKELAENHGMDILYTPLEQSYRYENQALAKIQQELYTFYRKKDNAGAEVNPEVQADGVRIIEAANYRLECEAVAADILRLVREKGYRWREIGLLIRETAYETILPMVLKDYGIPFFSDMKRPCANHPLAELIRSAINLVRTGWQYDSVFRCLKMGFFPISSDQLDLLENYVLEFGIRGRKRWIEKDWTAFHRWSLDEEEVSDSEEKRLVRVNEVRRQVAEPLSRLQENIHQAENTEAVTRALYDFLIELQVPEQLEKWAKEAEAAGRLAEAKEHAKVWADVMSMLDQLVELSGEEKLSLAEYEGILGEGLDALQVSLIPPGLDYVTVASFDQNSLDNQRAIYILGAVAGVLPKRSSENAILTDADRLKLEELKDAEVPLSVIARDNTFNEKYVIYRGFTQAREYLCVSYSLADSEGEGREPSNLVKRIRELLPSASFLSIPLESMEWQDEIQQMMIAEGRTAVSGLAAALRNYRERQEPLAEIWKQVYNWGLSQEDMQNTIDMIRKGLFFKANEDQLPRDLARRLYTKKKLLKASVSKLETYRSCPFKYYAKYGLKLEERREYKFRVMDFGTLLHGVLQDFGVKMKQENRHWGQVSEQETREICREILYSKAEKLQNNIMLSSKQKEAQLERIYNTACHVLIRLCALDKISSFHPNEFEMKFDTSQDKSLQMMYELMDECRMAIRGTIDRIDLGEEDGENHFLIIDYKSGEKTISGAEILYGLSMQLITYLLVAKNIISAQRGQAVLPAAMLYCLLQTKYITGKSHLSADAAKEAVYKDLRMNGWFTAGVDIIRAIDPEQRFIKFKLNKDGSPDSNSKKIMVSADSLKCIFDYVENMLQNIGNEIISGAIKIEPVKFAKIDSCKYCDYRPICGYSPDIEGYSLRQLLKKDNAEALEEMAKSLNDENGGEA